METKESSTDDCPRSTAHLLELQNLFSFGIGEKADNQITFYGIIQTLIDPFSKSYPTFTSCESTLTLDLWKTNFGL
jgi:hypothetical protein